MADATRSIHQVMSEKFDLAQAYAFDGAFHSAGRVLVELADDVKQHATWCDRLITEIAEKAGDR